MTPTAPDASADLISVPMFPEVAGPSNTTATLPGPPGARHDSDEEVAVTLPLVPVAQQRLPLLEASVASRHPQDHKTCLHRECPDCRPGMKMAVPGDYKAYLTSRSRFRAIVGGDRTPCLDG